MGFNFWNLSSIVWAGVDGGVEWTKIKFHKLLMKIFIESSRFDWFRCACVRVYCTQSHFCFQFIIELAIFPIFTQYSDPDLLFCSRKNCRMKNVLNAIKCQKEVELDWFYKWISLGSHRECKKKNNLQCERNSLECDWKPKCRSQEKNAQRFALTTMKSDPRSFEM